MHTLLVPVDGSVHAQKALQVACDLAEKYGGRIVLLHILARHKKAADLLDLAVAGHFEPKLRSALKLAADKQADVPESVLMLIGQKILEQAETRSTRRGIETEILPVDDGDPAASILLAQDRTKANTIVMGCRGVGTTEDETFGSVSRRVFAKASCTCLSVK